MLAVPQQQYIKFLYEVEECSIAEIADRVGVDWRTANKYATRADWNEPVRPGKRQYPVLGPYLEIIDTWLIDDEKVPRKQRHTNVKIFRRLRDEHNFSGGERTVTSYVAKRRGELKLGRAQAHQRLEHPGGEAQLDFCTVHVAMAEELVECKQLTLSFPYSNNAFGVALPSENQECLLHGMQVLFNLAGGVPRRIWFDNPTTMVAQVGKAGKRLLTAGFSRFVAHYRFEPVFCNPARGNEKGNVENKVGYSRRNWCVPVPTVNDLDELSAHLHEQALADRDKVHYLKGKTVGELWTTEKDRLLALPVTPFEVFKLAQAKVNKVQEFQYDNTRYPVHTCRPGDRLILKVGYQDIEVLDAQYETVTRLPRPYSRKTMPIGWPELFKGFQKRPRAVLNSTFVPMMPRQVQDFLRQPGLDQTARKQRIQSMIQWLDGYTLSDIATALADCGGRLDQVAHNLYRSRHPEFHPEPLAEPHTPRALRDHEPDLSLYNRLAVRAGD